MSLSFHIDFNEQCEAAFEYYAEHLGGKIGTILRYKDSPASATVAECRQNKIIHANILIHNVELAGADVDLNQYQQPQGFYVLLNLGSVAQVDKAFSALAVGGKIILAPQRTFWSPAYGIVVDRFAVPWKINCGT